MKGLRLLCGLLLAGAAGARGASGLALADNERLVYHVSWVVLPAGTITVSAHAAAGPGGLRLLRVDTVTATRGLAHLLLPFNAQAESLFDATTGKLVSLTESSDKRGKMNSHTVSFDYGYHTAIYRDTSPSRDERTIPMPPGSPTDLITCLLEARTWNLKPGQTRDALVLFEDQFYQLTVHAVGYETVTTPMGTYDTLVLEPRMEKTPPLGMFRKGSTVRVWISRDQARLPVRFEVTFKIGDAMANLVQYRPPSAGRR